MQDPEIIKLQLANVEKAGNYWQRNPWAFSVVFMLVCCGIVYGIMKGVVNDVKAERDLYKNIILKKIEAGEPVLNKIESKLDTLTPKTIETETTLDNIITDHEK